MRTKNDFQAAGLEDLPEDLGVFGIAVNDHLRFAEGEAVDGVNELVGRCLHPIRVRCNRGAAHMDGA